MHLWQPVDPDAFDSKCITCGNPNRDSVHTNRIQIETETRFFAVTPQEYAEWVKYDEAHPHLTRLPFEGVFTMFLNHFRRGINLNEPLKP
jgi:hypothetical protein